MATAAQVKRTSGYRTYGNVAYDPAYAPRREGRTEPLIRPRERVVARQRVRVRPAGYVAPVAVIGFALVAVMAVLLLVNYAQITQTSNEIVRLRRESDTLSQEHAKLTAEYELAFDLKSVEEQVTASGAMVQPQAGQIITLNILEPDSAQFYTNQDENVLGELWSGVQETVDNLVSFFR